MAFIHQDRDFGDLVRIVATETGLSPGLVEKDYWVTQASFIRHYEDAARIIEAFEQIPAPETTPRELAAEMLAQGQLVRMPSALDPGLLLADPDRRAALETAHTQVAPMYWGPRLSLDQACTTIRAWLASVLPDR